MTKSEKEAKRKKLQADLKALEEEKEELQEEEEEKGEEAVEAESEGDEDRAKEVKREKKIIAADAASVQSLIELLRESLKQKEGIDDKELNKRVEERKKRNRF